MISIFGRIPLISIVLLTSCHLIWSFSESNLKYFQGIQNCDLQFIGHYDQLSTESFVLSEYESLIVDSSQWDQQNTWNFPSEPSRTIKHKNSSKVEAIYKNKKSIDREYPLHFRDKFKIVFTDNFEGSEVALTDFVLWKTCEDSNVVFIIFVQNLPPTQKTWKWKSFQQRILPCNMLIILLLYGERSNQKNTPFSKNFLPQPRIIYHLSQFQKTMNEKNAQVDLQLNDIPIMKTSYFNKKFVQGIRNKYMMHLHGSKVIIKHKFKCDRSTKHTICDPLNSLINLASNYLNFTPFWYEFGGIFAISTLITEYTEFKIDDYNSRDFSIFPRKSVVYYMIYCENTLHHHSSSMGYWLSPFDIQTWFFILFVFVLTSVLSSRFRLDAVFFNVLEETIKFALRQNAKCEFRMQICVVLGCVILSSGYEAMITSFLTKPFPEIVYEKVLDMIQDGYKFLAENVEPIPGAFMVVTCSTFDGAWESRGYFPELQVGLKSRNLSSAQIVEGIEVVDKMRCGISREKCFQNRKFKLATSVLDHEVRSVLLEMNYATAGKRFCHVVPDVLARINQGWIITYAFHEELLKVAFLMMENGLIQNWESNYNWLMEYRKINKMPYFSGQHGSWKGLDLKGNFLHVFFVFNACIGVSGVLFLFERLFATFQHQPPIFY
ncbi:unnamed protein product [Orchesella dallaii]|uniref:Uncharacterized protein n=1 Tax=Orchesella dallaii TaxID=48710 RepID=A0ABP1R993_9HEXA